MRRFVFSEGTSNKFWEVGVEGKHVTTHFGRVGMDGQTQVKAFASTEAAQKAADTLIAEKTKKGYVEQGAGGSKSAKAAPLVKKPAKGAKSTDERSQVVDAWRRIEAWLKPNAPAIYKKLAKPASEKALAAAEKAMGIELPDGVRQLYLLHDGLENKTMGLFEGWTWLPINKVVNEWRDWKELLDENRDTWAAEGPTPEDADRGVRAENWNTKWIPITYSGSGDHHCVDLAPARGGTSGQIIRMWHDEPLRELKAKSIAAWLEALADGLESGRFTWSAEDERIDEAGPVPATATTPPRSTTSAHEAPTWAMRGHDAQRTGWSGYPGPQSPTQKLLFTVDEDDEFTAPAVAHDGTIYFGCGGNVYAVTPQGKKVWVFAAGRRNNVSGPVVGSDGTICVGYENYLIALRPDGKKKWAFKSEYFVDRSDIAIDGDGTVYFVTESNMFYAVTAKGKKWVLHPEGYGSHSSPAIGHDKAVYLGSRRSTLANGRWTHHDALLALSPDGTQSWAFATDDAIVCSPVVGNDGTIYVGSNDKHLYAITPHGKKKWALRTPAEPSSPALAKDGSLYLGCGDKLLAINPEGKQKWSLPVAVSTPPIVGSDGLIYIGTPEGLCAVTTEGKKKWVSPVEDGVSTPFAMTPSGTLYISSGGPGKLYAIGP